MEPSTNAPFSTPIRGADLVGEWTGDGRPLIWGHGLTGSRAIEDTSPLIDWTAVPARVLRYDARGHGESTSTPDAADYGWDGLARDQLALASACGVGGYISAGASMGCGTALHAAVLEPRHIEALILVIPPTAWETRAAQVSNYATAANVISAKGVEPLIAANATLPPPDPFVGDETRAAAREAAVRSWQPDRLAQVMLGATTADFPERDAVASLVVPTLLLAWTGDAGHPASTARELHDLIAGSELHLASTPEQITSWTGLVADFVSSVD